MATWEEIADMCGAAADAYKAAGKVADDPAKWRESTAEAKRLQSLADAAAAEKEAEVARANAGAARADAQRAPSDEARRAEEWKRLALDAMLALRAHAVAPATQAAIIEAEEAEMAKGDPVRSRMGTGAAALAREAEADSGEPCVLRNAYTGSYLSRLTCCGNNLALYCAKPRAKACLMPRQAARDLSRFLHAFGGVETLEIEPANG